MKQMNLVGVLVVLLLGAVGCGESQSNEIDRLNRKVAELDRENQQLWEQADLHKKEPWRSLANWNRIRLGMTRNQVLDIMGHPEHKWGISTHETWSYGPWDDDTRDFYSSIKFQAPSRSQHGGPPSAYNPMIYGEVVVSNINPPSDLQ